MDPFMIDILSSCHFLEFAYSPYLTWCKEETSQNLYTHKHLPGFAFVAYRLQVLPDLQCASWADSAQPLAVSSCPLLYPILPSSKSHCHALHTVRPSRHKPIPTGKQLRTDALQSIAVLCSIDDPTWSRCLAGALPCEVHRPQDHTFSPCTSLAWAGHNRASFGSLQERLGPVLMCSPFAAILIEHHARPGRSFVWSVIHCTSCGAELLWAGVCATDGACVRCRLALSMLAIDDGVTDPATLLYCTETLHGSAGCQIWMSRLNNGYIEYKSCKSYLHMSIGETSPEQRVAMNRFLTERSRGHRPLTKFALPLTVSWL